jgi:hypothetical protein
MKENPVHRLVKSGLTPTEAVDYWALAWEGWSKEQWADQRGTSVQTTDQNLQEAIRKITESPEIVHQVVADQISTHYDGELIRIENNEGVFMLSEQPENLGELENELVSRFPKGDISLMVLARSVEDGFEDVHIRIADAV